VNLFYMVFLEEIPLMQHKSAVAGKI